MNRLLKNWSIKRATYTVISLALIGAAFYFAHNVFLYILGIGFLFQSLTNTGCSSDQCETPTRFNYRRRH